MASSPVSWTRQKERSHAWLLRIMAWLSLNLGRTTGRVVLRGIALYYLLFAPSARRASAEFLGRALGRPATWAERYRHMLWFASTIHDRVFLLHDGGRGLEVEVLGTDVMNEAISCGQGALLVGAHFGSFEVLRAMSRQRTGLRVAVVMHEAHARKLNDVLQAIDPVAADHVIPLGNVSSMLTVRERLDEGFLVGILADRSLEPGDGLELPFLGHCARFPLGPWRLAAMLGRPVYFMAGLYLGRNRYQVRFERLADLSSVPREHRRQALESATRRYASTLERLARESPYNWFNFYDFWQSK